MTNKPNCNRITKSKITKSKNQVNKKPRERKDHQRKQRRPKAIYRNHGLEEERLNNQDIINVHKKNNNAFFTKTGENSPTGIGQREFLSDTNSFGEEELLDHNSLAERRRERSSRLQETTYQLDLSNGIQLNPILNRVALFTNNQANTENRPYNIPSPVITTNSIFADREERENPSFYEQNRRTFNLNLEIEIEADNLNQLSHLEIFFNNNNRRQREYDVQDNFVFRIEIQRDTKESKGLTTEEINEIGVGCIGKSQLEERCTICIEDFVEREEVRVLPCSHLYHLKCIDKWLGSNRTCPVCKSDIRIIK